MKDSNAVLALAPVGVERSNPVGVLALALIAVSMVLAPYALEEIQRGRLFGNNPMLFVVSQVLRETPETLAENFQEASS